MAKGSNRTTNRRQGTPYAKTGGVGKLPTASGKGGGKPPGVLHGGK
jgi:hypothetical protein